MREWLEGVSTYSCCFSLLAILYLTEEGILAHSTPHSWNALVAPQKVTGACAGPGQASSVRAVRNISGRLGGSVKWLTCINFSAEHPGDVQPTDSDSPKAHLM